MKYISLLAAVSAGFIVLSLELVGFRALAPYFGYSIYVFGSLIGLILLTLALGYALGGFWGSRISQKKFCGWILSGGAYITLTAIFYPDILMVLAGLDIVSGSLLASFLLFAYPMLIFAAVGPYFVARRVEGGEEAGLAAGYISAAGTLGSLLGTFLTTFWLLPQFGTHFAFATNAVLGVTLPVLLFVFLGYLKSALAFLMLFFVLDSPIAPQARRVIHAEDSAYAHLEVLDYDYLLALVAENRSGSAYSIIPKDGGWEWTPDFMLYSLFALPPFMAHGNQSLLLGLGAGTVPLIHSEANTNLEITGVEIDPKVVVLGKRYFDLDRRDNLKQIVVEDVRPYLRKNNLKYDLVEIDLFRGGVEIPFYLATREFFKMTAGHLKEDGLLVMNIYDPSLRGRVEKAITATIASEYPYVYRTPVHGGSWFVLAGKSDPLLKIDVLDKIRDPRLTPLVKYFKEHAKRAEPDPSLVLTDDLAPLEYLEWNILK